MKSRTRHRQTEQTNAAGGVFGRKIDVDWIDTRSSGRAVAPSANRLISKGAAAILGPCLFEWAGPALSAGRDRNVPAFSVCDRAGVAELFLAEAA